MRKMLKTLLLAAAIGGGVLAGSAQTAGDTVRTFPWVCTFENAAVNATWEFQNGTQTNKWYIGSATNHGGNNALYISNSSGNTNEYTISSAPSFVYATQKFQMAAGNYAISFDWKAQGESNYDYLRAFLIPDTTFEAGKLPSGTTTANSYTTTLPTGAIEMGPSTHKMNLTSEWTNQMTTFTITTPGVYKLMFMWVNDNGTGTQPPAAVDNIQIGIVTCPSPTGLAATPLSSDSIQLTWNRGTASQWVVSDGTNLYATTNNSYIFSGLQASTSYNLSVAAVCSSTDTSFFVSTTTRTQCGAIAMSALPWSYGFEDCTTTGAANGTLDPCWNKGTNSTTKYPYPNTTAHTGSRGLFFYSNATYYSWAAMPAFNNVNQLQVSFWLRNNSSGTNYNGTIEVGIMTDPSNIATFTPIDTVFCLASNNTWKQFTVDLNGYTGTGKNIAFRCQKISTQTYGTCILDDITVRKIPTCFEPTAVSGVSTVSDEVDLVWVPDTRNSSTPSIVEYGTHGFTRGTGTRVTVAAGTRTTTITGLNANTEYDFYVYTVCSATDTSDGVMTTVRTACNSIAYASLPWSYGFEGLGASATSPFDNCWRKGTNNSTAYPYPYSTAARTGSRGAYFYGNASYYSYAALPAFDSITKLQMIFYARNANNGTANNGTIVVGVMTDPNDYTTFSPVDTVFCQISNIDWHQFVVDFSNYRGNGHFPALVCRKIATQSNAICYVDDITVRKLPTCFEPTAFSGVSLDADSVTLTWTADSRSSSASYIVEYDTVGFTLGTGSRVAVAAGESSVTIGGFTADSYYDFYIFSSCGTDTSYERKTTVHTACESIPVDSLPWTYGFEDLTSGSTQSLNSCWRKGTNSTTAYPYPYSTAAHTGSLGVYLYGASSYYSWMSMPAFDSVNRLEVSFWIKSSSASYQPRIEVGVMTNPEDLSTFVPVDTVLGIGTYTDWREYAVEMTKYAGNGKHIAFRSGVGNTNQLYMDDITVKVLTCAAPKNMKMSMVNYNTAAISWNSIDNAYMYSGVTGSNRDVVYDTFMIINNVLPNTSYTAYVRTLCSSSDSSRATEFTFTTPYICPRISSLTATGIRGTSATINWTSNPNTGAETPNNWELIVTDTATNISQTYDYLTTNYYNLTGLQLGHTYRVHLTAYCDNDTSHINDIYFTTSSCYSQSTALMGTGTATQNGYPVFSTAGSSLGQSIFSAAELVEAGLTAGPITSMQYTWSAANTMAKEFSIYLGHTLNETYNTAANTEIKPLSEQKLVYKGVHAVGTTGTVTYPIDTLFVWDGVSNLVVTTIMNQPENVNQTTSGFYGRSTTCSPYYRSIYTYTSNAQICDTNYTTVGSAYTRGYYRPNIRFAGPCDTVGTCVAPLVTVDSANGNNLYLSWIQGGLETAWSVEYRHFRNSEWTSVVGASGSNSVTIPDLTPGEKYGIRVGSVCNDTTMYYTFVYTMPCGVVTHNNLPYYEDFNLYGSIGSQSTTRYLNPCWQKYSYSGTATYPTIFYGSMWDNSYTMCMYYLPTVNNGDQYMVTPEFDYLNDLSVNFWSKRGNNKVYIDVGVMSDPNDTSTFTLIQRCGALTGTSNWTNFDVSLRGYTGTGKYIAFRGHFDDVPPATQAYVLLDDITIDRSLSCARPQSIVTSGIGLDTVHVVINDTSHHNNYRVIITNTSTHVSDTMVKDTTDFVIRGLQHSIYYQLSAQSICSPTEITGAVTVDFTTNCATIAHSELPFFEDWDSYSYNVMSVINACYYRHSYNTSHPAGPYPLNGYVRHTGGNTFYFQPGEDNKIQLLALPPFDTLNDLRINFYAYRTNLNAWIDLGVMTDPTDTSSFTTIATISPDQRSWTPYGFTFNNYTGQGKYVAFRAKGIATNTSTWICIDDISIYLDNCTRPSSVTATFAHDTATLTWPDMNVDHYTLVFNGQTIDSITDTFYVVSGLTPVTEYSVMLRSNCDSVNYSGYLMTSIVTPIDTLPYVQNFDSMTAGSSNMLPLLWHNIGAGNVEMINSTYNYQNISMRFYGSTSNVVALPEFPADINGLYIEFQTRPEGSNVAATGRFDVGYLTDPNNASSFVAVQTYAYGDFNNAYAQKYVTFAGAPAGARMAMRHRPTNTTNSWYVDAITVGYCTCPTPYDLATTNVTDNSVTLTWASMGAGVSYKLEIPGRGTLDVNDTFYVATGLSSSTLYTARLYRVCSPGDTSRGTEINFTTACGAVPLPYTEDFNSYTVGTATDVLPNCWTTHYTGSSVLYGPRVVAHSSSTNLNAGNSNSLYMTAASSPTYGNTSIAVLPVFSDSLNRLKMSFWYAFQIAFNGTLEVGYVTSTDYATSFVPVRNIMGVEKNNTSHTAQGGAYDSIAFDTVQVPFTRAQIAFRWRCNTSTAYSVGIDNITVDVIPLVCAEPANMLASTTYRSATAHWTSEADSVEVAIAQGSAWDNNITGRVVTADSNVFEGLQSATLYTIGVRSLCDTNLFSNWTLTTITTDAVVCSTPNSLAISDTTFESATLSWTAGGNETAWEVNLFNSGRNETDTLYTTTATFTGLSANTTYSVSVRALCGYDYEIAGDWSDTISFTTLLCDTVGAITLGTIGPDNATISWAPASNGNYSYQVMYVEHGAPIGNATQLTTNEPNITITGLTPNTEYDVYVANMCNESTRSAWSQMITFRTLIIGIDDVDKVGVSIYPNPAHASATITLSGFVGDITLTVIDLNGRNVHQESLNCNGECTTSLTVNDLTAGTYFVRISGNNSSTVKKLIVK